MHAAALALVSLLPLLPQAAAPGPRHGARPPAPEAAEGLAPPEPLAGRTPVRPPAPGEMLTGETAVVVIRAPGSYVLTRDLHGHSGRSGIAIRSSGVTLDLAGHVLLGVPGSLDGIVAASAATDVRIFGGSILGWGEDGIDGTELVAEIEDLRVSGCGGAGIRLSRGSVRSSRVTGCAGAGILLAEGPGIVQGCVVESSGQEGIRTGDSFSIVDCAVRDCGGAGIRAGNDALVRGCLARGSSGDGITTEASSSIVSCVAEANGGTGVAASLDCTVEDCSALGNQLGIAVTRGVVRGCSAGFNTLAGFSVNNAGSALSACAARDNDGDGFFLGEGVTVVGCTAATNGAAGFTTREACTISDSTAFGNASTGIATGDASLVRGCTSNANAFGIVAASKSSVLDCVTDENAGNGIRVADDCLVRGNAASRSGGSGILVTGLENRIDSNQLADDDLTIESAGRNTLVRNAADDYFLAPGATGFLAPIRFSASGAGPWDNIEF